MWIFALEGFVSVVAINGTSDQLMVRGRVQQDVEAWHKVAGGKSEVGKARHTPKADYPWRFSTTRKRFAEGLAKMALKGLKYGNFKGAVGHGDEERARAYMSVWSTMGAFGDGAEHGVSFE